MKREDIEDRALQFGTAPKPRASKPRAKRKRSVALNRALTHGQKPTRKKDTSGA